MATPAAGRSLARSLPAVAPALTGVLLLAGAFLIYLLSARQFNAGRGDFFYLADAFLHGRTWLLSGLGPYDNVVIGGRVYVPFAPFPAILLAPLVAIIGPQQADTWQPIVNAALAAVDVWLMWTLAARLGVQRISDRLWLAVLFGFSTAIWWVTTRGGVWHTGHLIASMLTLLALIELYGRRRAILVGLLGGAAFLTRAPLLFAMPFYGLWFLLGADGRLRPALRAALGRPVETAPDPAPAASVKTSSAAAPTSAAAAADSTEGARAFLAALPVRDWVYLVVGFLPAAVFFLWYNQVRFGSPFESGYGLASLPNFLIALRAQGLFSVSHLAMNIDYLFWHLPKVIPTFPFFRPDGFGMSILLTSPALLLAVRADWRSSRSWLLAGAALFTLIPSLLYYGGGWLQYGYRYALDSIPFVMALCGLAAARHGIGWGWKLLIVFGVIVNLVGVYWAYNL